MTQEDSSTHTVDGRSREFPAEINVDTWGNWWRPSPENEEIAKHLGPFQKYVHADEVEKMCRKAFVTGYDSWPWGNSD